MSKSIQAMDSRSRTISQSSLNQNQEPEPTIQMIMEIVEESIPSDEIKESSCISLKTADFIECRRGRKEETGVVVGTTEYAISQVVSGDIQHSSNEGQGEEHSGKVQSASVTLFDPIQRESIIKYANEHSISQASRLFKVPTTTIKMWMDSTEIGSMNTRSKFNSPGQGRKLSYSHDTDDKIAVHIRDMLARGENVSIQYICNYAKTIIKEENPNFIASTGWAQRLLIRHAIDLRVHRMSKKKKFPTSPESGRGRPLSYSQATDKAIADYVRARLADGHQLTNAELRRYAKEEICKENPNFTGSASWAQNFFLRNKIALQSFSSMPVSGNSSAVSQGHPFPSQRTYSTSSPSFSPLVSMSPSLSDASLVAAEITPTSGSSGPFYSNTSMAGMENVGDDPMKTALTLLSRENIDLSLLSNTQVAALHNSLSEFTTNAVSLVDLLNSSGSCSSQQRQEGGVGGEEENGAVTLLASGLESPSGNVYLNLGGGGEGFNSDLTGLAATQVNPNTQTPPPTSGTSTRHSTDVVAQGSRPLSYATETDQILANWVEAQQAEGKIVTFASLRSYAKHLVASENPNFSASVGWVTPFLLRHNLDLSVNRKIKASRKGTPRKVASLDTPVEMETQEVHIEPEVVDQRHGSNNSSCEAAMQHHLVDSSSGTASITPEMLASAIATTLAEAVLAQKQQQEKQLEKQQQDIVLEYPPASSKPEEASFVEVQSSPDCHALPQSVGNAAMASLQALVGSEQELISEGEKRTKKTVGNEKTRTRHTLAEKLEVVQLMKEYGVAAHYVCRMLGIANSTFAGWTKLVQQKGAELQALSTNKKRANVSGQGRPLSYSREKDEQIAQWVKEQHLMGLMVSPSELSKHATFVISQENPSFTASSGWQQKFLQRHNLQPSNPWTQKRGSSPCSTVGDERASITHTPVVEAQQNIPMAVHTEEVTSNELNVGFIDKPYSDALDEELVVWVKKKNTSKEGLSVQTLCRKAEEMISKEVPSFVATLGWAFKFLHHHFLMLDPKPSSTKGLAGVLNEGPRKRPHTDSNYSRQGTANISSKYLHTPKKVRQMDSSGSTVTLSAASMSDVPPTCVSTDSTVSQSTGLCEALLAISSQAVVVESDPALQAAMQSLHNAMQQAFKQQQQQNANVQPEGGEQQQQQQDGQAQQTFVPLTVAPATCSPAMCSPGSSTRNNRFPSLSGNISSGDGGCGMGAGGGTPYNNYFGKPAREFSPEEKEEVVRYANATTLLKAALKYGVAAPTVWRWRVELKLHQPKYTAMQKKYIIKFAETNSLREASHRFGITSKTIQNWRKALQSDNDNIPLSGPASEDLLPNMSHTSEQMFEASSALPKMTTSHDAEVMEYDGHNFQFIVDGGEVSDTGGRSDHDMGEQTPTSPLSINPVPLEVTNEVDIENVGMEYDIVSSEGHAAKPRCTLKEKLEILQYAIEHSVREASQKFGISPGTLYYWKKMGMSNPAGVISVAGTQMATTPTTMSLDALQQDPQNLISVYPGTSSLIEQIHADTPDSHNIVQEEGEKVGGERYLSDDSDVHGSSTFLPNADMNLLHAVSSLLNCSGGSVVTASSHSDLSPMTRSRTMITRNSSLSGGISSPTDVLVAPVHLTSEEMTTSVEEIMVETNTDGTATGMSQASLEILQNVVVVEVEPHNQENPRAIAKERILDIETDEVEQEFVHHA